jgi:hypothetical protein
MGVSLFRGYDKVGPTVHRTVIQLDIVAILFGIWRNICMEHADIVAIYEEED